MVHACACGCLSIARWMRAELALNHTAAIEQLVRETLALTAAGCDHVNGVVLWPRFCITPRVQGGTTCFLSACAAGHLDVVQWLQTLPGFNFDAVDDVRLFVRGLLRLPGESHLLFALSARPECVHGGMRRPQ